MMFRYPPKRSRRWLRAQIRRDDICVICAAPMATQCHPDGGPGAICEHCAIEQSAPSNRSTQDRKAARYSRTQKQILESTALPPLPDVDLGSAIEKPKELARFDVLLIILVGITFAVSSIYLSAKIIQLIFFGLGQL